MKRFSKLTLEIKLNDTSACMIENVIFIYDLGKIYILDVSILLSF